MRTVREIPACVYLTIRDMLCPTPPRVAYGRRDDDRVLLIRGFRFKRLSLREACRMRVLNGVREVLRYHRHH